VFAVPHPNNAVELGEEDEAAEEEDGVGFLGGGEDDDDNDNDDDDSFSSISESSIIDLPPPLSPSRIKPPISLSIPRALNLVALEETPVLGPLVRRSRSARFLVGSLGRRNRDEFEVSGDTERGRAVSAAAAAGPSTGDGYGTFNG
jgi:hypothetical protein